jgi:hypothetical protein
VINASSLSEKWIFIVEDSKAHGIRKLQISNASSVSRKWMISLAFRKANRMGFSNPLIFDVSNFYMTSMGQIEAVIIEDTVGLATDSSTRIVQNLR